MKKKAGKKEKSAKPVSSDKRAAPKSRKQEPTDGTKPFFQAALEGKLEEVESFLAKGIDPNSRSAGDATALMFAAHGGHTAVVERLLDRGADPNLKDAHGYTALMIASKAGHAEIVRRLISAQSDVSARAEHGNTALLLACQDGRVEAAKLLLAHGADASTANDNGAGALLFSVIGGHADTAALLLQHGAQVNAGETQAGHTPLVVAAATGRSDIIALLLQHGADMKINAKYGKTPLMMACGNGHLDAAKLLLSNGADVNAVETELGMTALMAAAVSGYEAIVDILIKSGAELNVQSNTGHTALMYACRNGLEKVVRLLLEHNANVFLKNQYHEDAMMHAKAGEHDEVVDLLAEARTKQAGQSTENLRQHNADILLNACSMGDHYIEQVRAILEQGADLEARNRRGFTPLLLASYFGATELTRALMEHGADVNAEEETGGTPLYWACFGGRPVIAQMLLEKGARLGAKIWEAAQNNGSVELIDLLMAAAVQRSGLPAPILEQRNMPFSEYQGKRNALRSLIRGDANAARAAAETVLFFDPDDAFALLIQGMACNATGDVDKAREILSSVPKRTFSEKQAAELQDFLQQLLKESQFSLLRYGSDFLKPFAGKNPDALFAEAVARGAGGDPAGARETLQQVVELKPDHFDAWYNLGISFMETEEPQKAIPCFEHALSLSPGNHTMQYQLAVARETSGDEKGALQAYEDAYKTRPTWGGQRDYTQQIEEARTRLQDPRSQLEGGHERDVECVAFSSDGKVLVSGSLDRSIRLWEADSGKSLMRLSGHSNSVQSVAFSPDGQYLASWECLSNTYFLWNLIGGKRIKSWSGASQSVWQIAFSPDGRLLAVEADKTAVALLDIETRTEKKRMTGHTDEITCVAFHPDGALLASGSRDQTVRVWDISTCTETKRFEIHNKVLGSVAFSPDGRLLATGGYDGIFSIHEVDGWKEVRILRLEHAAVKNIVFSHDSRSVYFIAHHTVHICDVRAGDPKILIPDISVVSSFALTPDNRLIATGHSEYQDQRLHIWDVSTKKRVWKI